jgi:hypothetical protein
MGKADAKGCTGMAFHLSLFRRSRLFDHSAHCTSRSCSGADRAGVYAGGSSRAGRRKASCRSEARGRRGYATTGPDINASERRIEKRLGNNWTDQQKLRRAHTERIIQSEEEKVRARQAEERRAQLEARAFAERGRGEGSSRGAAQEGGNCESSSRRRKKQRPELTVWRPRGKKRRRWNRPKHKPCRLNHRNATRWA